MSMQKPENLLYENSSYLPPRHGKDVARVRSRREYEELCRLARTDPSEFWASRARSLLHWFKPWHTTDASDFSIPKVSWFAGGRLNAAYNCVDRHIITDHRNKAALIWQGEREMEVRAYTYQMLYNDVCRVAAALDALGIKKGDRVALYLPMIPELVIAMLACARLGAIHTNIFTGYAEGGIHDSGSKVVITADAVMRGGQPKPLKANLDKILNNCPTVQKVVVVNRTNDSVSMLRGRDIWWQDFLEEEAYEEDFDRCLSQVTNAATQFEDQEVQAEEKKRLRARRVLVDQEAADKMYSYIELNYGRSYLSKTEQERVNRSLCRGAHADCSLYFTDGILSGMVKKNYQSEYARRARSENLKAYGHCMRVSRRNIEHLSDTLRRALTARSEREVLRSEFGRIVPAKLWKVGRSRDKKLFERELRKDSSDFAVYVLIDASGSQKRRQSQVALQGYIISEALSIVEIPHQVMGFCTFWDYTVMQRYRDYDDPREANQRIFEFYASSNNRDGLAVRAAADSLMNRPEEHKVLIVLSDGRPNDIIVNRPGSRNPMPYSGDYAVRDTAAEVRKVRAMGISVLGVFAGEEQDLQAERRIFGRDFAYIRDIMNFSGVVGRYLRRQLDDVD